MAYSLRMESGIIRVEFTGTLSNLDLMALAEEVAALEATYPVMPNRCGDVRLVQRIEIDFAGVFHLAETRRRLTFPNSFKTAIIVREPVHFGFARMFQTLNDHPQITIAIFREEEPALEWLRLADPSPPGVAPAE